MSATEYVPCLGGCGRVMPTGQKCIQCATDAVHAWLLVRKEVDNDTSMAMQREPGKKRRRSKAHSNGDSAEAATQAEWQFDTPVTR